MSFSLLLDLPALFDFEECLWFLHRNYDECLYQVRKGHVIRALRFPTGPVIIKIERVTQHLQISILHPKKTNQIVKTKVRQFVREWFDLKRDIAPFYNMVREHRDLRHLVTTYSGLRMMRIPDMFEAICWCIIGQQINLTFAYSLKRRLVENYGTFLPLNGENLWMFPTPNQLLLAREEDLKRLQFSRQKINYLLEAARAMVEGTLSRQTCEQYPSLDEQLAYLQAFKGIGPWTSNYVAMKCLGDASAVPWGDAGLLSALEKYRLIKDRSDRKGLRRLFRAFTGYESYLVLYLWRSLSIRV